MILSKKYACLPEVHCGLLQGRESRHINTSVPEQGLVKKGDNKNNETEEVEDTVMKDQNDIDNHNVNIHCKENDVFIEANEVNKVNVNNNYERIEVICNDENKSVKDYLNHGNIEKRNPEDGATNDEMNILLVVTTQDVLEFQKVPREQINSSLSDKEVSTLLVVATTDKITISKHAKTSK